MDEFSCASGECIPQSKLCNSFPDCEDETDELNCDGEFKPVSRDLPECNQIRMYCMHMKTMYLYIDVLFPVSNIGHQCSHSS